MIYSTELLTVTAFDRISKYTDNLIEQTVEEIVKLTIPTIRTVYQTLIARMNQNYFTKRIKINDK